MRHSLHSCWPCDSSSKGYRWLHFVQAYRADVAILAQINVTELEEVSGVQLQTERINGAISSLAAC